MELYTLVRIICMKNYALQHTWMFALNKSGARRLSRLYSHSRGCYHYMKSSLAQSGVLPPPCVLSLITSVWPMLARGKLNPTADSVNFNTKSHAAFISASTSCASTPKKTLALNPQTHVSPVPRPGAAPCERHSSSGGCGLCSCHLSHCCCCCCWAPAAGCPCAESSPSCLHRLCTDHQVCGNDNHYLGDNTMTAMSCRMRAMLNEEFRKNCCKRCMKASLESVYPTLTAQCSVLKKLKSGHVDKLCVACMTPHRCTSPVPVWHQHKPCAPHFNMHTCLNPSPL